MNKITFHSPQQQLEAPLVPDVLDNKSTSRRTECVPSCANVRHPVPACTILCKSDKKSSYFCSVNQGTKGEVVTGPLRGNPNEVVAHTRSNLGNTRPTALYCPGWQPL